MCIRDSTTTFSYLNVQGSNNTSADAFSCLTGCINGGSNTNWTFPVIPANHRRKPVVQNPSPIFTPDFHAAGGNTDISTTTTIGSTTTDTATQENTNPVVASSASKVLFTKDLRLGDISAEVKLLQQFFNSNNYPITLKGPGSKNNETTYFGSLTKAAVIRFQEANSSSILKPLGLTKGTGIFGASTRNFVNSILK